MWRETNVFGVFLPPLLVYMLCALGCYLPLRWVLRRLHAFRWLANPPLCELAIYTCILAVLLGLF